MADTSRAWFLPCSLGTNSVSIVGVNVSRWIFVSVAILTIGCSSPQPSIVFEVSSPGGFTALHVAAKRYFDDGSVVLYPSREIAVDLQAEQVSLLLNLPEQGRYAIHFVDVDHNGTVYAVTRCHEVNGAIVDRAVELSELNASLDGDGDTFPEDMDSYCEAREALGLSCDMNCAMPAFSALVDCNPYANYDPGPNCPEAPQDQSWHPFSIDGCADCHDQDCYDGDAPCQDNDGDGYPAGADCDDTDPTINPEADDICSNSIDENCRIDVEGCESGDRPCDNDGDGVPEIITAGCGSDCNDTEAAIYPDADESCDGIDNNCNGVIDEGCFPDDIDQDGVPAEFDCNDCDAGIGPEFTDSCGNGVDEDCDDADVTCSANDADGDGQDAAPIGSDCDDTDGRVFAGAPDRCGDGVSQNCAIEQACDQVVDLDDDSFGAEVDCDDNNAEVNPWAVELCDEAGSDEDCDGSINEVLDSTGLTGCGFDPATSAWYAIEFATDPRHCGFCRNDCVTSRVGNRCVDGSCACADGEPCEGGLTAACCVGVEDDRVCVDLTSDVENCGSCGRRCSPGEECLPTGTDGRGQCVCNALGSACPTDECIQCCPDEGCVDVCNDLLNCGDCDVDCSEGNRGDRCVGGECFCSGAGVACTGSTWCTEITEDTGESCGCADLVNDPNNCQGCGNVCPFDECEEAACEADGCHFHTLDADNDGYCQEGCNDNQTGEDRGECRHGDCDDTDPDIRPEQPELCATDYDDDCDGNDNDDGAVGCTIYHRDEDDDGYGVTSDTQCLCSPTSLYNAADGGDCNDDEEHANPGEDDDDCNGYNDDCDSSTDDGDTDCPGFCCGGACRECCFDAQCPGAHPDCTSSNDCACQSGWSSCGGTCNCHTGDDDVCCSSTCYSGNCCDMGDCGTGDWTCTDNLCSCAGVICGNTCYGSGTCCDDGDCTAPALCNLTTHLCG